MGEVPKLGQIITDSSAGRDAVHIAVAPVEAGEDLCSGDPVKLNSDGLAINCSWGEAIGIVDPFFKNCNVLSSHVRKGERFYLCLFPNTVTSLRHVWTHPAFAPRAVK